MNEEISIIDNETKKEKIIKFFKKNKKKLIIFLLILILIPFIFFSYQIYLDKKKEKISSKYNLAVTKFENGNDLEFKKALKLHPKNLSVLVNYANLKSDLNQIDEAIALYKAGFEIDNNHETLLINYINYFKFWFVLIHSC